MNGAVLCMVFPTVLDSQNTRQMWCQVRRRVAGDGPRTDQKKDGKGGEKSGSTASGKLSWLPRWLSFCLVVRPCVWVLVSWLFVPSWSWVLGAGLGCPGPFPRGWLLPLSFLVPAPVLVFVRKGDDPRTDPVVPLPVRASFRYTQVLWRYGGVLLRLLCWRYWEVLWHFTPPHILSQGVSHPVLSTSFLLS